MLNVLSIRFRYRSLHLTRELWGFACLCRNEKGNLLRLAVHYITGMPM